MLYDLLAFIVFFATLKYKVLYDYKRWLFRLPINHALELFCAAIPMCYVIYAASLHGSILLSFVLVGGWFMFLFNGWYNFKRKFGWWFIGSKDAGDSMTEKIFRFVGPVFTIIIQLVLVIVPTILYVLNFFS